MARPDEVSATALPRLFNYTPIYRTSRRYSLTNHLCMLDQIMLSCVFLLPNSLDFIPALSSCFLQVLECTPRGKALQLMAAASQKEHFFDPLSRGEMPPAAVSRLRATHTVAGSLSTANVRSSSSSQHLYQQQHHHHRGGKNPSLIAAPARRTLQANSSSFPSSSDIHHHQEQHGERYSHGTSRFSRRQLAANNAASFDIDVYLASSPACGNDWEDTLKRAYAPYLKQVLLLYGLAEMVAQLVTTLLYGLSLQSRNFRLIFSLQLDFFTYGIHSMR